MTVIAIFTDSCKSYAYKEETDSGTINNNKTADLTIKMFYFLGITDS